MLDIVRVTTYQCAECGVSQTVQAEAGELFLKKSDAAVTPAPPVVARPRRVVIPLPAIIFIGLLLLVFSVFLVATYSPAPSETHVASASDARYMCKKMLKERLNDPSSAEWVDENDWPAAELSPQEFSVRMQFRAKNVFGGLVLKGANCKVRSETASGIGNWRLVDLNEF
jgi:hypothetical protein